MKPSNVEWKSMPMGRLDDETGGALASLLLVRAARTPTQKHLAEWFISDLEQCDSLTGRMKVLTVALSALLTIHDSGCGEVATISPFDSGSSASS